ncbi:MAG: HAD hydrolase-like protein [archaeon]
MNERIFVIDFAGTLIRPEIIEEANRFRAKVLRRSLPSKAEHSTPENLYKANREFVEKLVGLKNNMTVLYRENNLALLNLTGEEMKNQIATNLFQIGMFMAAKKHGRNIFPAGLLNQLQKIQRAGYKLAIVSGVRTDIISGMLAITKAPIRFDYVYGQPPILGVSNEQNLKALAKHGTIAFVLGDKLSDLEAKKMFSCKAIFARWGHASGGEEKFADYMISKPGELSKVVLGR